MRSHSEETSPVRIFVEFIALILRNRIYSFLKDTLVRLDTRTNYMTVPAALRGLENIKMVLRSNGQYRLGHAVSRKQKVIMNDFGFDEGDVRSTAAYISNLLINNQYLFDSSETEDNEEG